MAHRVVLLSGGVGGAKLAEGLYAVLPPDCLTVVANTGDDIDLFGLSISPDVDIVTYTLAGCVHSGQGWGIEGDSFRVLDRVRELGGAGWFNLGDVDLGVHLYRSQLLSEGIGVAEIARRIAEVLGVKSRILPMCESPVRTWVDTDRGRMHLQEYLVRHRAEPIVRSIRFEGIEAAKPAPGVIEALGEANVIIIAPSNPLISIGPILAVPGLRDVMRNLEAVRVAVCPIVAGKSLKGPSDRMLAQLGHDVTSAGVASLYQDILDGFVIDTQDKAEISEVQSIGLQCRALATVMSDRDSKASLARKVLEWAGDLAVRTPDRQESGSGGAGDSP